jgi:hypothetical protein
MMNYVMFSYVMPLAVFDPVTASRMFDDEFGQVIYFTLDIPVIFIVLPNF